MSSRFQSALAEHIVTGNLVYHGLAGSMLLRGLPAILRLRLIAPMKVRIRRLWSAKRLPARAPSNYINDVDEIIAFDGRRFMYDVDFEIRSLYEHDDQPTSECRFQAACGVHVKRKKPEFEITGSVRARLADFSLACRVKVALATHPASRGLDLDVDRQQQRHFHYWRGSSAHHAYTCQLSLGTGANSNREECGRSSKGRPSIFGLLDAYH